MAEIKEAINKARNLFSQSKPVEGVTILLDFFSERNQLNGHTRELQALHDRLIMQSSKLNELIRKEQQGSINQEDIDINKAKIISSVLGIANELEGLTITKDAMEKENRMIKILTLISLTLFLVLLGCIFFFYNYSLHIDEKILDTESSLRLLQSQLDLVLDSSEASISSQVVDGFKGLTEYEGRIAKIEETQEHFSAAFDRAQWILGFCITLASFIFGFVQYIRQKKEEEERARIDGYMDKLRETNDKLMANNEKMMDQYSANFDKSSLLIETIKNTLESTNEITSMVKEKTEELDAKISDFNENRKIEEEKQTQLRLGYIKQVNTEAIKICDKKENADNAVDRDNYKDYDKQVIVQNFKNYFETLKIEQELKESEVNANSYLLLALDAALKNTYNEADKYLDIAIKKAETYSRDGATSELYPGFSSEKVKSWNNKLANICYFHKAIIYYNFGLYQEAERFFRLAIQYDPNDVKSLMYIPEAKYLAQIELPDIVHEEFEKVGEKINKIPAQYTINWKKTKDEILAEYLIRYGNCFYPSDKYDQYKFKDSRDLKKAGKLFYDSHQKNPNFFVAIFSLAQAYAGKASDYKLSKEARGQANSDAKELFQKVFEIVNVKRGKVTEDKIAIMYYYILAICSKELGKTNQAQFYLEEIFKLGGRLPNFNYQKSDGTRVKLPIKIYSPLSKLDFSFEELIKELSDFQNELNS